MPYTVFVDDNYHYMDECERYELGTFETLAAAIEVSKSIVDDYLATAHKAGMSARELFESYTMFGEDPYIVSSAVAGVPFSAWDYARERCDELCKIKDGRK